MTFTYSIGTAFNGLQTNRGRSSLTILGIVIGITSIILVMSLGEGASDLILNQIQGIGSKTIVVVPGKDSGDPTRFSAFFVDTLKERELEALQQKSNVPTLQDITPVVLVPGTVSYHGEVFQGSTIGASEIFDEIFDVFPAEGEFFGAEHVRRKDAVAVIGSAAKEELFASQDALGETITIKDKSFRVVGVFPKKGRIGLFDMDDAIIIPHTTAQSYLTGKKHYEEFIARARTEEDVPRTARDIELTLRELHDITDPEKDDFHVHTQADIAQRVGMVTGILTLFLTSIAAIALLVGGVGIMNIMLVSVTERTREIGLRKAIGATNKDILTQFLLEAVMLTTLGGVIGIIFGASLSFIVSLILSKIVGLHWVFTFPITAALLGLGVAALVGLIFGLYPARKASQKNPIEALRYE